MATAFSKDQREFIVRGLAQCWSYSEICAQFTGRWTDTKIGEQDVKRFDPLYNLLPPDLHKVFEDERAKPVPAPLFADRNRRLELLSRMVEVLTKRGGYDAEVRAILRQIAEETSDGAKGGGGPAGGEPVTAIERVIIRPDPVDDEA